MYVHATFFSWTYIAYIEQILSEAQHQWLRPVEICEILRNYTKFCIASETGNRPPNGSLFLFDRKRKKKDGKTVKEAHERLKVGSIDVLHCYYAHGKENENFQRCSYWLLEENANLWSCFVVYDNFCCYTHRILQCTECLQRCTVKKGKHAKLLKCSIRH